MQRIHLFEFHDQPWLPPVIRDSVVESLGRTLAWGRILHGLVKPFSDFMAKTGAREVLELCSGSGQVAALWVREMAELGAGPPDFLLTDRFPRVDLWQALSVHSKRIRFVPEPVEATAVAAAFAAGRPRLIANAFHHFPPREARRVVRDAIENSPGIFICENFERNPWRTLGPGVFGLAAVLSNPALSASDRRKKALMTWVLPAAPIAFFWDGLVSAFRIYSQAELMRMVEGLSGVDWTYGTFKFSLWGRGMYFYGVRRP